MKMSDKVFQTLGVIIIAALICFTILSLANAGGTDVIRDVLIGLMAGITGGYAIAKGRNGNNKTK